MTMAAAIIRTELVFAGRTSPSRIALAYAIGRAVPVDTAVNVAGLGCAVLTPESSIALADEKLVAGSMACTVLRAAGDSTIRAAPASVALALPARGCPRGCGELPASSMSGAHFVAIGVV